jgi:hypothetical protein
MKKRGPVADAFVRAGRRTAGEKVSAEELMGQGGVNVVDELLIVNMCERDPYVHYLASSQFEHQGRGGRVISPCTELATEPVIPIGKSVRGSIRERYTDVVREPRCGLLGVGPV